MADECEHGAACHDGTEPAMASAPEASRAWLAWSALAWFSLA